MNRQQPCYAKAFRLEFNPNCPCDVCCRKRLAAKSAAHQNARATKDRVKGRHKPWPFATDVPRPIRL